MRFLLITLIVHNGDRSPTERLREVVDNAVLAEELGFDGFGVFQTEIAPVLRAEIPSRPFPGGVS
ncbi:LLM class flavin-dependent oxidoreductase [Nonomuraea roseoviolacea]|uniref:LLM class flavin-dependent oxidoreductase n=1 Tax=Nonomuraea roseoviolacea subsp. carminata TaxID=160689 RepID=A0ABT1K5L2_9ACTN|nr:LLM class flavin-dependent oxidoreductase [Nonomuraea roseoviolacea]MCP2349292.1 hypothetical protein [Nonomuraea roseoviolacea subsp. carminata]